MAFGVKYRLTAESKKFGNNIKIDIEQDGYAGAVIPKFLGAGGITLNKNEDGNICGTSLNFSIQSDVNFEYFDFFLSPTRKYKVKLYINETITWSGYLISDEYREPFRWPPYDVQLTATDGLGLLKNYIYQYDITYDQAVYVTRAKALYKILANTGLELDILLAYDMDVLPAIGGTNLFNYAEIDDSYYKEFTCYDVLQKMIPPDATITQHNNYWLIRRNEQDSEKTHLVLGYSNQYLNISTATGETVIEMNTLGFGDIYPIGMPELSMLHGWKSLKLINKLAKKKSFLRNYDFAQGMDFWYLQGFNYASTWITDGQSHLKISGSVTSLSDYVSQSFQLINEDNFVLELQFSIIGKTQLTGNTFYGGFSNLVLEVSITDGSSTYYLQKDAGWVSPQTYITEEITTNPSRVEWHDLKIYTTSPPISGVVTLKIFRVVDVTSLEIIALNITNIIITTEVSEDYLNNLEFDVNLRLNGTQTEEVEMTLVDAPVVDNSDKLFYNGQYRTYMPLGKLTPITGFISNTETATFTSHIINSLTYLHGITRQIISGTFRGADMHLNAVCTVPICTNRKYIVKNGSWDVLFDKFNVEWLEIPGTASDSTWILENGVWDDQGVWKDDKLWNDVDPDPLY